MYRAESREICDIYKCISKCPELFFHLISFVKGGDISNYIRKITKNNEKKTSFPCHIYHIEKKYPASGDITIIMTENVNDDMDIRVALCSDGNIPLSFASVLIWIASSDMDDINPPITIR